MMAYLLSSSGDVGFYIDNGINWSGVAGDVGLGGGGYYYLIPIFLVFELFMT